MLLHICLYEQSYHSILGVITDLIHVNEMLIWLFCFQMQNVTTSDFAYIYVCVCVLFYPFVSVSIMMELLSC